MGCGKSKSEDEPSESDKQSLTEGAKDGKSKKSGASDEKTPQGDQTTSRIQSTDVIDMVMQGIYGDDPAGGKEPGEIAANDTDGLEARGQAPELSPIVEETENDRSSTEDTTSKALPKVKKLVNAAEADEEHDLITAEIFRGAQMSEALSCALEMQSKQETALLGADSVAQKNVIVASTVSSRQDLGMRVTGLCC